MTQPEPDIQPDPERDRIVTEEQTCLDRVLTHVAQRRAPKLQHDIADYDARLLDLRDQIAQARMEDVPPLVQEMERLQLLASRLRDTSETQLDASSPYFGRLVLEENGRQREVLIGRGTYLDTQAGIRIVDWRDAPVSRLFYRYEEGDDYDEEFGGREVSGTVATRRSLVIAEGTLERIQSPQGAFARRANGWKRLADSATRLAGGAGSALRAEQHHRPGKLGTRSEGGEDKVLREITALIDPRQFDLITKPNSGLVVIQGGAGSGKTTIGLHRLAYLAFQDPRRFRPDRLLVIVFNTALARYISGVLPALGVNGVAIRTYEDWASRLRQGLFPGLPLRYRDDTPAIVTRLKKHPAMLALIEQHVQGLSKRFGDEVEQALGADPAGAAVLQAWNQGHARVLGHRLHALGTLVEGAAGQALTSNARIALERVVKRGIELTRDVFQQFAELVSDRALLERHFAAHAPDAFRPGELARAANWCAARIGEVLEHVAERAEQKAMRAERAGRDDDEPPRRSKRDDGDDDGERSESASEGRVHGIDGQDISEGAALDLEDDTLLLRLSQRLRGPLTRGASSREPVLYEHVLVDEAQDLSPVELAVVLGTVSNAESVTLAGDVQQRLLMDNGFSDFQSALGLLNLRHVEVEPLKLSYRSTREIIDFARAVLGPLASSDAPQATRSGAPIELFRFAHTGNAVAFLGEALRELMNEEPNASVAVVTRFPEQADTYYAGLVRAEIPKLRRVADQDFPFKPGIDITDVRQVKGLEFDYVVLVEVNEGSYPADDEARHLLHIGATRAAHQLWVVAIGRPSPLLPKELLDRAE